MDSPASELADELATLRAEVAIARARMADDAATIVRQKLEIAKLKRQLYGPRSERSARLVEQMELELEELEAAATEDELAAEMAAAKTTTVAPFARRRPSRQPFPAHLPRERIVVPGPTTCACCGGNRLRKLGETVTETLEVIPRQWKVIQHVREKMTCRDCEQADAYGGYIQLYEEGRTPGPILEAACWAHARRPFFALADIEASARRKAEGKAAAPISPLALEAVRRIDRLFEIERGIIGKSAAERHAIRQEKSAPIVTELGVWMREERARLSRGSDVAKAMDYMLKRWPSFTRFLDDGRVCLSNNAAERGLRGIALGRKSWLFAGSDRGGQRAAAMYSLIVTAKLNDIDPQGWLADVLARIAAHPASQIDELLPWNWRPVTASVNRAA